MWALSNCTGIPNANDASKVSLCAASTPSISKVGSASAYPSFCASASTVAKGKPRERISDKMKLVVPLIIPATHSMRLAVKPSRIALMIGIPPATAASNATITPLAEAAAKISVPCLASKALLAVTTCLPWAIASSTNSRARVSPPINSTTISMEGSRTTAKESVPSSTASPSNARALAISRTATRVTSMLRPARREISPALRANTFHVPPPTTPSPNKPTLIDSITTIHPFETFL